MKRTHPLAVIFFTVLVDMIGVGILIPVFPQLLAEPGSASSLLPAGMTLDQGYMLLGVLSAVYPFMTFLSAPVLGQLSDRYGRRKVLALCLAGTAIGYALFAIGILLRNLPLVFFSRIVDGITGGNIAVAQASIADISKPEDRAKNFGLIGAAFGLGFILGPLIGGKLSDPAVASWFSAAVPFWFAAGLATLNLASVLLFFPETHPTGPVVRAMEWLRSFGNLGRAWRSQNLRALFATSFLFNAGTSFLFSFFAVFLLDRFGFGPSATGNYFAYVGICIVLVQAVLVRKLAGKIEGHIIVQHALFGLVVAIALHLLPRTTAGLIAVTPLLAIANGLVIANLSGLISRTADASNQGETMGINSSVQALAQSLPPLFAGTVAALLSPSALVGFSSLIVLGAAVLFAGTYRPRTAH